MAIASQFWEFGDGQVSTETSPSHVYEMSGSYYWSYKITDLYGNEVIVEGVEYVYDFSYKPSVPNASLTEVCYRVPAISTEGGGVSEYKDSYNNGRDWLWPPAMVRIGTVYDDLRREIALVLDSKTQREYQINDFDVWRDRVGAYEGNTIKGEMHQKAHFSNEGEHVPIRHIEHHLQIKSFDRLNMQNQPGYDSVGLPINFEIENQLFQDEEPFTPSKIARDIQPDGDLVFQDKTEARNLQLRSIFKDAPYLCTGVIPYYETVDRQQTPLLRVMSEDGYQTNISGTPYFHVSRNFDPLLNLATGADAHGGYAAFVTGPDGKANSGISLGAAGDIHDNSVTSISGDFSIYLWVRDIIPAVLPIQLCAFQNFSLEIHDLAGEYITTATCLILLRLSLPAWIGR